MSWNCRSSIVWWIVVDGMLSTFTEKQTAVIFQIANQFTSFHYILTVIFSRITSLSEIFCSASSRFDIKISAIASCKLSLASSRVFSWTLALLLLLDVANIPIIYFFKYRSKRVFHRQIPHPKSWCLNECFSYLTSKHSLIASWMFPITSFSVLPWLTQPGITGHSTMNIRSSSWRIVIRNFISLS